jgi:hypothetical protein
LYRGIRQDLSDRIYSAGPNAQRRLARELTLAAYTAASNRTALTQRTTQGIRAVLDGTNSDAIRQELSVEAVAFNDRYEILDGEREDAEERGQTYPADKQAELKYVRLVARVNQLLADALDADANTAAQMTAYTARFIMEAREVDNRVESFLNQIPS